MRAVEKYKGTQVREFRRRVAQSYGYKHTLYNQPLMVALLKRAGIIETSVEAEPSTERLSYDHVPDTKTITL